MLGKEPRARYLLVKHFATEFFVLDLWIWGRGVIGRMNVDDLHSLVHGCKVEPREQ